MACIAVVDDEASLRAALERLLRGSLFQVLTFRSAEEFLGRSGEEIIICLIPNIHLGGMTGFELQEHLAASGSAVPTIFITGHDDVSMPERARAAGAAGYLRKPIDRAELLQAIRDALGQEA